MDEDEDEHLSKRSRDRGPKINYWETNWGKMLQHPEIGDPTTKVGKQFRRRFRVPFPFFREVLIPVCTTHNIFPSKKQNMVRVPLEFKLLICLRMIGRGLCADDAADMAWAKESTCHALLKSFCRAFTEKLFPIYVTPPTGDRLRKTMQVFAALGLIGAAGS